MRGGALLLSFPGALTDGTEDLASDPIYNMPLETIGGLPPAKRRKVSLDRAVRGEGRLLPSVDCAFRRREPYASRMAKEQTISKQSDQSALGTKTYHREFASQEARHMKKPVIGEHNHEELHCDMME